jgi:hypothetical protein
MPTYLWNNQYHNVEFLPPQPISSVVGDKVQFNAYIEQAGLNQGYNYQNFGNKFQEHQKLQSVHRNAQHPNQLQDMLRDPSNILPNLMPQYYTERPNYSYLSNPPIMDGKPLNPNYDYSSQRTNIPAGFKTAMEGYPTVNPIMVGLASSQLSIGPAVFNK